jgi:hypothetical protein
MLQRSLVVNAFAEPQLVKHARVIVQRRLEGKTYKEIAKELDLTKDHIQSCARMEGRCLRGPPLLVRPGAGGGSTRALPTDCSLESPECRHQLCRLHIRSKFISGLLENTDAMLSAQGEELGSWYSSQFRSHASRDAAAFKHLESRHELDLPRCVRRALAQSRWQFRRHLDIYGRHDVPSITHVGGPMSEVYPTQAASS